MSKKETSIWRHCSACRFILLAIYECVTHSDCMHSKLTKQLRYTVYVYDCLLVLRVFVWMRAISQCLSSYSLDRNEIPKRQYYNFIFDVVIIHPNKNVFASMECWCVWDVNRSIEYRFYTQIKITIWKRKSKHCTYVLCCAVVCLHVHMFLLLLLLMLLFLNCLISKSC